MDPQDQQLIDGDDVGVGQFKALDLVWVVAELVTLPALQYPCHQSQLSHTAPKRGRAMSPCSHMPMASVAGSPAPTP